MTDKLPVNDLDTLSHSPRNLREAIDVYAQVFEAIHGGTASSDVLAEFDLAQEVLSPKEAFSLLRQYDLGGAEGGLTQWQRMAFDYLRLSHGSLIDRSFMPSVVVEASKKASARIVEELATALEDNIQDGKIADEDAFLTDVLALRLQDGSVTSQRVVCETVRRALHYQRTLLRGAGWARNTAKSLIDRVDGQLKEIDDSAPSLAQTYEEDYAGKPYDDEHFADSRFATWVEAQDANIRIRAGKVKLTSFPQTAGLRQTADPRSALKILDFLKDTYQRGLAKDKAVEEAANLFRAAYSTAHFFALGEELQGLDDELRLKLEPAFLRAFENFAVQSGRLWETVKLCALAGPREGKIINQLFSIAFEKAPQRNSDAFAESFLDEQDISVCSVCYKRVSESARRMLNIQLLGIRNMANAAFVSKLAIYLSGTADAHLELKSYLIRNAEFVLPQAALLFANVRLALAMAGADSAETEEILEEVGNAVATVKTGRKGDKGGRVKRTAGDVRDAVSAAVVTQTPGLLSQMGFAAFLKEAVEKLALPDDIVVRARSLTGTSGTLTERIFDDVLSHKNFMAQEWDNAIERTIECEAGSFLRMIGIKAVRFKKTHSFDVELICDKEQDGTDAFHKAGHLDDVGQMVLDKRPFFERQWAVSAVQAEILRLFYKLHGGEDPACDADSILLVLGLKEWEDAESETPQDGSAATAGEGAGAPSAQEEQPSQMPKAPPIEINTKGFLDENFRAFEDFLKELRIHGVAMPRFEDIADVFRQLQARMRVNKAVPPQGIKVMPAPNHVLQPYVEIVEIYNPLQSREMLNKLGIDPAMFHQDVIDAYFCRVDVRIGEGTRVINVCIVPPNYDVYVIGVDPEDVEATQDNACMAFMHLVLDAFRRAVVRLDDPDHTAPAVPAQNPKTPPAHPWARRVERVVRDVTKGEFPVIVTSWKTPSSDRGSEGEETAGAGGERARADNRSEFLRGIFKEILEWQEQGEIVDVLASHGIFLQAEDFIRFMPDGAKAFPPSAWRNGTRGPGDLKQDYSGIYMPLDSPAISRVLGILGKQRLIGPAMPDAAIDLNVLFEKETSACGSPAEAFRTLLLHKSGLKVDSRFFRQCRALFATVGAAAKDYPALFNTVLDSAREADSSVTAADVFRAFAEMSPLNPEKLRMAVSGGADYRLPYRFRQGGEGMPGSLVFNDGDFEVAPGVPLDVVAVIAGNRARMSSVSTEWLRGDNRSQEMDFAAGKQNPYRSARARREISLEPRARALLVWEFEDGKHAFTYLDTTQDSVNPATLVAVPAEKKLRSFPRVHNAIRSAATENAVGAHSDFRDLSRWNTKELIRLEREGVVGLSRDSNGRVTGIEWSKPIKRKKVVILKDEQVGFRQFQLEPTTFAAYQRFLHQNGAAEMPTGAVYDPKIALIQQKFYGLLNL